MVIFAEPPHSRFDVRFRIAGVPVRVHPWFWVATVLLAIDRHATVRSVGVWVVAVFVSILVHELGHALAFRRYGARPRIALYAMGGVASADEAWATDTPRRQMFVALAGPVAGFALAGLLVAALGRLGYRAGLLGWTLAQGTPIPDPTVALFVGDVLFICVIWGLVNLAPVHPLDGGAVFYGLFFSRDPHLGAKRSLRLSVIAGAAIALVAALVFESTFAALLFGWLALSSYQALANLPGPAFEVPRPWVWLRERWQTLRRARRRQKQARHLRLVDKAVQAQVQSFERAEDEVSAEVAAEADALLRKLTDEIQKARKTKPPPVSDDD